VGLRGELRGELRGQTVGSNGAATGSGGATDADRRRGMLSYTFDSVRDSWLLAAARLVQGIQGAGALLYPPHCAVCLAGTMRGCFLCEGCLSRVQPLVGPLCRQCSRPHLGLGRAWEGALNDIQVSDSETYVDRCADCMSRELAFDSVVVAYRASGVVRELVHQFKYNGRKYLVGVLAQWLVQGLNDKRLQDPPVDVLVPVPLYWRKLWRRGFNQSALLALEVQRFSGLGVVNVLRRVRDTGSQTRLHRKERLGNLRGAFEVRVKGRAKDSVAQRHVVLVDDVLTTGATLDACASVLRQAGALSVRALVVARG